MGPFLAHVARRPDIAFIAADSNKRPRLWVHSLESAESREMTNAGDVRTPPFWSPDSRWMAFAADGKLKRIDITGGPPEVLCDVATYRRHLDVQAT